jgi:hypothetical protein
MLLQSSVNNTFLQLSASLEQLSAADYSQPITLLGNASIGQHVRHIIELFQCLEQGYAPGVVNYDNRKRDLNIEQDKELAINLLQSIQAGLKKHNKDLQLEVAFDESSRETLVVATNFHREVAYNLEHTIHHMALIRVGITALSHISLPESYGVAASTLKYRSECAQ